MSENKSFEFIQNEIQNHKVVLFIKGTKEMPYCGFSATVVSIFSKLGMKFHDVDVLTNPDLRQSLKIFSDWPTFPQVYIKGEFLGGCDIIKEMYQNGDLEKLLNE